MKAVLFITCLITLAGCRESYRDPESYLQALMGKALLAKDGSLELRVNRLPLDYFLVRELSSAPSSESMRSEYIDSIRKVVKAQYGGADYFLLRISADSSIKYSASVQELLVRKMVLIQSKQEAARLEISGYTSDDKPIHPDLFVVNSDWIFKQGVTILFGFSGQKAHALKTIEFGKSFVHSKNLMVEANSLETGFIFKG